MQVSVDEIYILIDAQNNQKQTIFNEIGMSCHHKLTPTTNSTIFDLLIQLILPTQTTNQNKF